MATSEWKTPFLKFRDAIRPHFDAGIKLYHAILMSPFYEEDKLKEVVDILAPTTIGLPLAMTIETEVLDCHYHAQYFYGDSSTCRLLNFALSGIEDWLREVPKGLLPQFHVTSVRQNLGKELAIWANLVYFLAWEIDAPYLQATVESQTILEELGSVSWEEGAWPQTCDPRPALIHQGSSGTHVTELLDDFSNLDGRWCPDILGAYLSSESYSCDFIGASLAAVDLLIFMLEQVREQQQTGQQSFSSPAKRKLNKPCRVSSDVKLLKGFLRIHHDPRETQLKALIPLTAEQIAEAMGWTNESGKPIQSKASRRMAEIFGPNAMVKYRSMFEGGKLKSGFKTLLGDGSLGIEAVNDGDDDDDPEENDLD